MGFVIFYWVISLLLVGCLSLLVGDSGGSSRERKATLTFLIQNNEKISNNFRKYLTGGEK
jgi:hypothetical protein